jgi:hypothetical protein
MRTEMRFIQDILLKEREKKKIEPQSPGRNDRAPTAETTEIFI